MRELMQLASEVGVRVHVAHFSDDPNLLGFYSLEQQKIVLRFGLTPFEMRSVLAHELAHAYYGDECSSDANERRAERYAAQLLSYRPHVSTARFRGGIVFGRNKELRVTVDVVETYRSQCLQRLGGRTYGRSWRTGISPELARKLSV